MGEVYESGVFTIASNLSDDVGPWLPPDPVPWALKLWKGGPHKAWLSELVTNGPLASRGWCLQERHLSPRILHVYHKQVWVWECGFRIGGANCSGLVYSSDITDHTLSWRKQNLTRAISLSRNELLGCWDKLVVDYTKRRLTNQSDRLAAISGIERRLQPLLSCAYHAGIWESDIFGLLWYCGTVLRTADRPSDVTDPILLENLIENCYSSDMPSWSWAASEKPVRFLTCKVSGNERGLQEPDYWGVNGKSCTFLGEIHYSTTSDESIHLGSSIKLRAPVWLSDKDFPSLISFDSILEPNSKHLREFWLKESSRDEPKRPHFVVLGVDTGRSYKVWFGIILAPSKLYEGAFMRLGMWYDALRDVKNLDVKIEYTLI